MKSRVDDRLLDMSLALYLTDISVGVLFRAPSHYWRRLASTMRAASRLGLKVSHFGVISFTSTYIASNWNPAGISPTWVPSLFTTSHRGRTGCCTFLPCFSSSTAPPRSTLIIANNLVSCLYLSTRTRSFRCGSKSRASTVVYSETSPADAEKASLNFKTGLVSVLLFKGGRYRLSSIGATKSMIGRHCRHTLNTETIRIGGRQKGCCWGALPGAQGRPNEDNKAAQ